MIEAANNKYQIIDAKHMASVYLAAIALGGQTLKLMS
jgi:hypothetical protein